MRDDPLVQVRPEPPHQGGPPPPAVPRLLSLLQTLHAAVEPEAAPPHPLRRQALSLPAPILQVSVHDEAVPASALQEGPQVPPDTVLILYEGVL